MYTRERPALFLASVIRWRTDNPSKTVTDALAALSQNEIEYMLFGISLDVAKSIIRSVYDVTTARNSTGGNSSTNGVAINGQPTTDIQTAGGIVANYDPKTGTSTLSVAATHAVGNYFVGIYDTLKDLQDAAPVPGNNYQAIVVQPLEYYYHGVGGTWVQLAPVGSIHAEYIGAYDTLQDLTTAEPTPADNSLAIVGTDRKAFYMYHTNAWEAVQGSDVPSLVSRMDVAEQHLQTLQTSDAAQTSKIGTLETEQAKLKTDVATKISGVSVKDAATSQVHAGIHSFTFDNAEVDPNDATTMIVHSSPGKAPSFDPSMFQSAVDHGYAADNQGVKSGTTTDGWWIFKDLKSVSGRPSGAVGDVIIFKNTVDTPNPALKHVFMMAIGKDSALTNKMWFQYRDGLSWTPWFTEQGATQGTVDALTASVDELKKANQATIDEVGKLQTAIGKVYTPGSKQAFDAAVNALIDAKIAESKQGGGHSGDHPETVYPRFYAQFSNSVPTSFTSATTSTNAEATLVSAPAQRSRIFISVTNDNDEASKVKGFKFNNKLEMTLDHRDIVVDGVKYRSFYTAGSFQEAGIDIKVDFGQGI